MYYSINQWCRGNLGSLAFEAESSYSSIRIWRMDPYEYCPLDVATGLNRCPEDASATFTTLPGFISGNHGAEVCTQSFLVVAPTIAYLDENNIALTVLNTTFANVDVQTLSPIDASKARSVPGSDGAPVHVHPNPRGVKHLPLFLEHPIVLQNGLMHSIQQLQRIRPGLGK